MQTKGMVEGGMDRRALFSGLLLPWLVAVALAGCSTLPKTEDISAAASVAARQATHFQLKGRVSVRTGQQLETGNVIWTREVNHERLALFTPLGGQIAEILRSREAGVVMRRGEQTVQANSIGELTENLLGVALDLDRIAAWTQGIGLVDGEMRSIDLGSGEVWQVTAERFQVAGSYRFVARLSAVRGDAVIRLVIDEWQAR